MRREYRLRGGYYCLYICIYSHINNWYAQIYPCKYLYKCIYIYVSIYIYIYYRLKGGCYYLGIYISLCSLLMPYWLSLCVLLRTCRQNRLYETLFHTIIILSKHHHHHHIYSHINIQYTDKCMYIYIQMYTTDRGYGVIAYVYVYI
jgi:hypothetical protein